jgi:hypothetical protein
MGPYNKTPLQQVQVPFVTLHHLWKERPRLVGQLRGSRDVLVIAPSEAAPGHAGAMAFAHTSTGE